MTNIDIARIIGARAGNLVKQAAPSRTPGYSRIQDTETRALTGADAPYQPFRGDPYTTPKTPQGPMDPTLKAGLIGSLLGAGVGGIGNAAFGNKRKSLLSRLGMGALGGAAVGGLGGAGINELGLRNSMDTDAFGPDARRRAVSSGSSPIAHLERLMRGPQPTPQEFGEDARMFDGIKPSRDPMA
jgi:hypothetical protein